VFGTSANVQSLSSADLQDYVSANFTAPRIALAAAGGVDHSALVKSAEANLGGLSGAGLSGAVQGGNLPLCRFTGGSINDRNDDLPFNHVAIAVHGCGWSSDDHLPLMVAKSIIGSWSKGMAGAASVFGLLGPRAMKTMEAYNGFSNTYTETSLFGVHLVSNAVDLDDAMECVTREMVRLCGDITDSDVARAKATLQTNLLLQQDDSSGVCANIGQHMLAHGRHISALDVVQSIDAISLKEVKDVCMKYIYDTCPAVASLGPTEGVQDYNIVRSRLYWMRF
jgi:processing peptidase subunit beta